MITRQEIQDLLIEAMEKEDLGAAEEYQAMLDEMDGLNG